MSLPVVLRPEASRDAEESRDHYDSQTAGLGQKFLDRLNDTLARIGLFPEGYGVEWRDVRAARLRRFRHIVYYRVRPDRVEVVAVMFAGRDPFAWQDRV